MQRRATVVAELRASRIDVVAEEALGEGEEHGQHLDGKITSRRKSRSGEFRYLPKGDDGDLAYAEMHEIQPPNGRDVWCANVHEASDVASSEVAVNYNFQREGENVDYKKSMCPGGMITIFTRPVRTKLGVPALGKCSGRVRYRTDHYAEYRI